MLQWSHSHKNQNEIKNFNSEEALGGWMILTRSLSPFNQCSIYHKTCSINAGWTLLTAWRRIFATLSLITYSGVPYMCDSVLKKLNNLFESTVLFYRPNPLNPVYVSDNHLRHKILLTFRAESVSSNSCTPKHLELYYCFIICTSYNNYFWTNCYHTR